MTRKLEIKDFELVFNYHYRYSKNRSHSKWGIFRRWNLGLWIKKDKVVGKKDFNKPSEWSKNLVRKYSIGVDLLIITIWLDFSKGSMTLGK